MADVPDYASVDAAVAATIPSTLSWVRVAGRLAPGDGGGALYRRVATQPAHGADFQSADGAWWELAEVRLDVRMFGVFPNGDKTLTYAALMTMRAYMATYRGPHYDIVFPAGYYATEGSEWLLGVRSYTVHATGVRISNQKVSGATNERVTLLMNQDIFLDNALANTNGFGTWNAGYKIETVAEMMQVITLTTSADAANFAPGDCVFIYGWNTSIPGYPPCLQAFEWSKVYSVDTGAGTVTLTKLTDREYRKDWPDIQISGVSTEAVGQARMMNLNRSGFQVTEYARIVGLECLPSAGAPTDGSVNSLSGSLYTSGCVDVELIDVTVNGYFYPTDARSIRLTNCNVNYCEADKSVGRFETWDTSFKNFGNGPGIYEIIMNGGTLLKTPTTNLTSRRITINGTTLHNDGTKDQFFSGSASPPNESITLNNVRYIATTPIDIIGTLPLQTGMATNQVKLPVSASAVDNIYNNYRIYITGGTGNGQSRAVTAYVGSTQVANVASVWTTQPDTTSTFRIDRVVPLIRAGATATFSVIDSPAADQIRVVKPTTYPAVQNDPAYQNISMGSIIRQGTASMKVVRVYQDQSDAGKTIIQGSITGSTFVAGNAEANICNKVTINDALVIGHTEQFQSKDSLAPFDIGICDGVNDYKVTYLTRTPQRIVIDPTPQRYTGASTMYTTVVGEIVGLGIDVETASGVVGAASVTFTRPSTEGATPWTVTIDLKTAGQRYIDFRSAFGAVGLDSLPARLTRAFFRRLQITASGSNVTPSLPSVRCYIDIVPGRT